MLQRLSRRVRELPASQTLALAAQARALKAKGVPVIDFGLGEPDFNSPLAASEGARAAMERGDTHYPPVNGTPTLKQAILTKLGQRTGWEASPDEVLVSCGAKHVLMNLFLALLDEGDEAVFPSPYWVSYPAMIQLAGGRPIPVETRAADGFRIDPAAVEAALTPRTKLLLLNSPNNPTGAVADPDDLRAVVRLALERGVFVISDEIYGELVFGGATHLCAFQVDDPRRREQVIVVDGVSKTYAMTGWRIGWAVGPKDVIAAAGKLQSQSTSGACSVAQAAAAAALEGADAEVKTMHAAFARRREVMLAELRKIPGAVVPEARGAFYAFPDLSAYFGRSHEGRSITGSAALSQLLLEKAHVALVAGESFGADAHLRLSYALDEASIREGVGRIARVLSEVR
mgnify:CR=1 FL=1